jgi:tetratricopeptide (TPR) repeat protein
MTRIAVPLVFLLTLAAAAQRTNPGANTDRQSNQLSVDVRIATDDEQPIGENVRVQLLKFGGSSVAEVMAMSGRAQFAGIAPGAYTLRVSGVTIEELTTPIFEVRPAGLNAMQILHVKLRSQSGTTGSKQGSVSAQDLKIPPRAKKEFNKAGDAMQQADWERANGHLEKAVSIYPEYAAAYNNLGAIAMRQNDLPLAQARFEKAIELNDSSGSAYINLGRLYLKKRDFEGAARLMSKSLAVDPNNPEALTMLADCEVASGHYDEAIANVRRVHAVAHERFAVAHLIAAAAYEKQDHAKDASAEYEQFLKEDPNSPRAASARRALERLTSSNEPGGTAPKP